MYAAINKGTLACIFEGKKVSKEYVVSKTGVKPEKLDKWLDETDILPPFTMSIALRDDPILWARRIRELLDVQLDEQYKCASPRKFYLYLREKVEAVGIFVHCFTDVPMEMARALAIYDGTMPIIGLNDEDRPPAKSFSMIHELVHIFKRESLLCNDMRSIRSEEVFCNAVAGEFLVPKEALESTLRIRDTKI